MAATTFANVFEPDVFTQNLTERIMTRSKLWRAGVLANDADLDSLSIYGGREVTVPFWKPITLGEAQTLSDSADITVSNITMGSQVAHVLARAQAWGNTDLSKAFNNRRGDPLAAIQTMVADYWANEQQTALLYMLRGVFGTSGALTATHSFDYETTAGDVAAGIGLSLDPIGANSAKSLLGDNLDAWMNAVILIHPDVYYRLENLGYIKKVPVAVGQELDTGAQAADVVSQYVEYDFSAGLNPAEIDMFAGMQVIVDAANGITKVAGTTSGSAYTSYMIKRGAIAYGNATAPNPVEYERKPLVNGGTDVLVNRMHYIVHPYGMSFSASGGSALAGATPTNAELATVAKWSKVFTDNRNIEIVRIRTNG